MKRATLQEKELKECHWGDYTRNSDSLLPTLVYCKSPVMWAIRLIPGQTLMWGYCEAHMGVVLAQWPKAEVSRVEKGEVVST